MKRKYNKNIKKRIQKKKPMDLSLDSFFQISNNKHKTKPYKKSPSPILNILNNSNDNLCIIRNPSKTYILEDSKQELQKYHKRAEKTILCDDKIIELLYDKLNSSFDKINRFLVNNKKFKYNHNINQKDLLIKFLIQLKYIDISYISPVLLNEKFNEEKITQNLKNFIGYNYLKGIQSNFLPNNIKECQTFWQNITELVTKYLKNFHEGNGLFIYVKHDYLSYLKKIKLLCNLFNYETSVIDESNENKCMLLDKLSEAMQTKRLPSISENLGAQILMLEEMVNSFSYKWEIFSKNLDRNKNNNNNNNNNNIIHSYIIDHRNNKSSDISSFSNNISSISLHSSSSEISSNDKIQMTTKDLDIIYEELDIKNKTNLNRTDNNITNDDMINKLDSSTNETIMINYKGKLNNKIKDIKSIEQNKLLLSKKDRNKTNEKSKDRTSKNNTNRSNNKSSENKKRKNKKNENDMNNTDIKGYFRENTKEHKIFTQLQNNIFLYCTKAKTAIIIADSFSDKDIDKKYFNNILLKVSQTRIPIIVLTNNLDYLYSSQPKKIKNLNINCILSTDNKRDINVIHLYIYIIYLNIKLCSLKFGKSINTYEQLMEYINNNIDTDMINFDLCSQNLKYIYNTAEYICHYCKFQIDVIDLRLSELFLEVEREINENNLSSSDFNGIIEYIYNIVFPEKEDFDNDIDDEKSIEEIFSECEMNSFLDYSDGIKNKLIEKYYKAKLNLNDSYKNYMKSKDSMVNLEGLILGKYFNSTINNKINNNNTNKETKLILYKSFSFNDSINNKIINQIQKADQLFISHSQRRFITISFLPDYVYPINRLLIIKKNFYNKYYTTNFSNIFKNITHDENSLFIDAHVLKKLFQKIECSYFFNKNFINYVYNRLFKESINQKKIKVIFYEK